TYLGSCHCGAIRYKFWISPPLYANSDLTGGQYEVVHCNCSICSRNGYLLVHPRHSDIQWMGDSEKHIKKYYMASKSNPHYFCEHCGSSIGTDLAVLPEYLMGDSRFALNVRMIKDVDLNKLKYKNVPGI
ncbi:Mss4-like protein, partial [Delphinella strobiligena]